MPEEEKTSPGIDPEVLKAMESLSRVQRATCNRVSDITQLIVQKKNTPVPAPHR